jgi:hypothetical protein
MKNKILKEIAESLLRKDPEAKNMYEIKGEELETKLNLNEQFSDVHGTQFGVKDSIDKKTFEKKSKMLLEKWNKLTFID